MGLGFIGFSQPGDVRSRSFNIWADCPNTLLNDKGLGVYINQDFRGDYATPAATTTAPGIESFTGAGTSVFDAAASATFGPNVLSMATGASDNNNNAIFGEELGQIVRNSGKKMWFEAILAPTLLGDTAFFVGLTTRAGVKTATTGLLAADPSNSAVAATVAVSTIGFLSVQTASAIAKVNAVYSKGAGSPVSVLADVLSATGITSAGGTVAPLTAATFFKLGIRFDGYKHVEFYANGYKVASVELDSTFDQSGYYVPCVVAKNGSSTALTLNVDQIAAAFQSSN